MRLVGIIITATYSWIRIWSWRDAFLIIALVYSLVVFATAINQNEFGPPNAYDFIRDFAEVTRVIHDELFDKHTMVNGIKFLSGLPTVACIGWDWRTVPIITLSFPQPLDGKRGVCQSAARTNAVDDRCNTLLEAVPNLRDHRNQTSANGYRVGNCCENVFFAKLYNRYFSPVCVTNEFDRFDLQSRSTLTTLAVNMIDGEARSACDLCRFIVQRMGIDLRDLAQPTSMNIQGADTQLFK